jgi:hypothetical protein
MTIRYTYDWVNFERDEYLGSHTNFCRDMEEAFKMALADYERPHARPKTITVDDRQVVSFLKWPHRPLEVGFNGPERHWNEELWKRVCSDHQFTYWESYS